MIPERKKKGKKRSARYIHCASLHCPLVANITLSQVRQQRVHCVGTQRVGTVRPLLLWREPDHMHGSPDRVALPLLWQSKVLPIVRNVARKIRLPCTTRWRVGALITGNLLAVLALVVVVVVCVCVCVRARARECDRE